MASPVTIDVNENIWGNAHNALSQLLEMSSTTFKRNAELEARIVDLEVELAVWKQAHSAALDAADRSNEAHNVQISTLNRQMSNMNGFNGNNSNPLILCAINGDERLFSQALLVQGQQGGRAAAQQLTQHIAEYLTTQDVHISGRLTFWVSLYFNKRQVAETIIGHNICTPEQFESFMAGFSNTSPRFVCVDCLDSQTDVKIREYLQIFARLPQTLRVFLSSGDISKYHSSFQCLQSEHLINKLVLLEGTHEPPTASMDLLPVLKVGSIFMTQHLDPVSTRPSITVGVLSNLVSTNGGLISPQSPPRSVGRLIDPMLPLHKQMPPPCNEHYLMTCSKGANACKYSHDYVLTTEQLASLSTNAKKAPCNWLKNGMPCPYGDGCCWGHLCPNGPKCFHLSKGKCWFKGDGMHPPLSTSSTPPI